MNKKFSGYIGHVVKLKDGRSARIIEGIGKPSFPGHKIYYKTLTEMNLNAIIVILIMYGTKIEKIQ